MTSIELDHVRYYQRKINHSKKIGVVLKVYPQTDFNTNYRGAERCDCTKGVDHYDYE